MTKTTTKSKCQELGTKKLASSGLTLSDASLLNIKLLDPQQTHALHHNFLSVCSLQLNYHSPDGGPAVDWPGGSQFYRLRYLEAQAGFDSLTDKKAIRYVQLPLTAPVAYYPRNQAWGAIITDPHVPLIITEGELKAAKACKEGFPTIGLGGVYNFRSIKLGITWLPSLEWPIWERRNVYIIFDSDYRTNINVCLALKALADELINRGAFVHLVNLPAIDGLEKVGLDDFLVTLGPSGPAQLRKLLHEAEPLGLTKPLWVINSRYAYVQDPGLIVNLATGAKIAPAAFKDHHHSTSQYQERELKIDGSISYKPVSAAAAWLKWPLRLEVTRMAYVPGKERLHEGQYNLWAGWGVEPKAGDVKPFLTLLHHLFAGVKPEVLDWFLCWCAYPLQYPGVKMFSSVVIHGIKHGTGKSLIAYTLGKIYGRNFTEINQRSLLDGSNEWADAKQFVLADDISGTNKRQDADVLKKLITQERVRVNIKYVPVYELRDCINYYFTANHPDAFFLEDDDRRYFIHEVIVPPMAEEFYVEYDLWLASGGAAAVFDYLLKYDTGTFNPAAPALRTDAKTRMITVSQSDLASWVRQLVATPDAMLRLGGVVVEKDIFTTKELLAFYDPEQKTGVTPNGMARELARAGVRVLCCGAPIRTADGAQSRYFAIRNMDRWQAETPKAIQVYLDKLLEELKKKY